MLSQLVLPILLLVVSATVALPPQVLLRNAKLPDEATYSSITSEDSNNQLCLPQNIKAREVCVKAGIWLFYPEAGFLAGSVPNSTLVLTRNYDDAAMTCYPLPGHLDRNVGSFRLAGNPLDDSLPALNLYVQPYYADTAYFTASQMAEVEVHFNSAIASGGSCWEFFMRQGFDGFSECTRINEHIPDFTERFGVQPGDIKSLRPGCSKGGGCVA